MHVNIRPPRPLSGRRLVAFAEGHPSLFVLAGYALQVPAGLWVQATKASDNLLLAFVQDGLLSLAAVLLIAAMGWSGEVGFRRPRWRTLWLAAPALILALLNFSGEITSGPGRIAALALVSLVVGFQEETWWRGVFLRALLPRYGPLGAAALLSLFFGLAHSLNLLSGQDTVVTAVQIVGAMLIAFVFAGLRLRTGSLWPAILIHAVFDFMSWVGRERLVDAATPQLSQEYLIQMLILSLVLFGYGLILLRGARWPAGGHQARADVVPVRA